MDCEVSYPLRALGASSESPVRNVAVDREPETNGLENLSLVRLGVPGKTEVSDELFLLSLGFHVAVSAFVPLGGAYARRWKRRFIGNQA